MPQISGGLIQSARTAQLRRGQTAACQNDASRCHTAAIHRQNCKVPAARFNGRDIKLQRGADAPPPYGGKQAIEHHRCLKAIRIYFSILRHTAQQPKPLKKRKRFLSRHLRKHLCKRSPIPGMIMPRADFKICQVAASVSCRKYLFADAVHPLHQEHTRARAGRRDGRRKPRRARAGNRHVKACLLLQSIHRLS